MALAWDSRVPPAVSWGMSIMAVALMGGLAGLPLAGKTHGGGRVLADSVSETFTPARPRLSARTGALVGAGLGAMVMAAHLRYCEDCGGPAALARAAAVTVVPGACLGAVVGATLGEGRFTVAWRLRF